ncbi:class I SAM-dependent methyltransferase [Ramlibacter tataouinensis]|uniref:class I SAM-dependent methyltransferase n=1 Tax=Ramlibacter tataouinensis TaxID=94132 RepID=UPI0022F3F409|nr:class I SAM-dependent methyltransferase [Ramlibacter tataouinensis]WBY00902.1 class I SAM-dependent methyltransferase [Ramlibacter tataouinensis]
MTSPNDHIREHYRQLLKQHGDTAAAAQYSSRDSQERRFRQLARIGELRGARVLDFGCGSGHLATYLAQSGFPVDYTGVDIVPELLQAGRAKHPQHRFGLLEEFAGERFDYVLVSGVYNNARPDNRQFWQDSVRDLFVRCDRGLAFNMMSTYVDYRDRGLFYESPEHAFAFVKRELTPYVNLIHDYLVKDGSIPFEFCIHAYRQPSN